MEGYLNTFFFFLIICVVAGQSRQSRTFSFTLSDEDRKLLQSQNTVDERPPYQIRFYCARYAGRTDKLEVEFPGICELKVNDNVIPGQVKCFISIIEYD